MYFQINFASEVLKFHICSSAEFIEIVCYFYILHCETLKGPGLDDKAYPYMNLMSIISTKIFLDICAKETNIKHYNWRVTHLVVSSIE